MFYIRLPHPKHPLTRYNTRQLMAWYEDCALAEAILASRGVFHHHHSSLSSQYQLVCNFQHVRWDIDEIVQKRGISHIELASIQKRSREDVNS